MIILSSKKLNLEDAPRRESTSKNRQYGWDAKEPRKYKTIMWNRAYHYLDSMVGQEWDYVWADICRPHQDKDKNKLRKWLHDHLLDGHIVDHNIKINSKGAPYSPRWGRLLLGYWVHPTTGVLNKYEKGRYQYLKPKPRVIKFEGQEYAPDNNGIWYMVALKDLGDERVASYFHKLGEYDVLLNMNISSVYKLRQEYGRFAYCASKKQIGKRLKCKILKSLDDQRKSSS